MAIFYFVCVFMLYPIVMVAGWISNVIWTFHQHDLINLALGIFGAICAPVGALHGLYLFF